MIRTNIKRQRRSYLKGTFKAGDVFGMHIPAKGWIFGRVIRDDVYTGGDFVVYIYDTVQPEPAPLPKLLKKHLLIPPFITFDNWIGEYIVLLDRKSIVPEDLYEKHYFQSGPYYLDEFNNVWGKARPTDVPCGNAGLTPPKCFDDNISRALGVPLIPEDQKDIPPVRRGKKRAALLAGPGTVTLHFPLQSDDGSSVNTDDLEYRLRKVVEKSGAGKWEGHGFDMARDRFETSFDGPNAGKLLDALRKGLRPLRGQLPRGWKATIRYGIDGGSESVEL